MKNIDDFCDKRAVPANLKEAFVAYIKTDYSIKFAMNKEGDTVKLVVSKMNSDDLEDAWKSFVLDMAKYIHGRI